MPLVEDLHSCSTNHGDAFGRIFVRQDRQFDLTLAEKIWLEKMMRF